MNQDIQIQLPAAVAASTPDLCPAFVTETRNATKVGCRPGNKATTVTHLTAW